MAVITVSRQYGSEGDEIAARACETLGYRLFDKRLMAQVASEMGLSDNEIVDFSEANYKVRSFLERLFIRRGSRVVAESSTWTRDTAGTRTVEVEQLDEEWCVRMVKASIEAACKQDNIVIVGRGGQAILQDKPGVLHVRVQAPLEKRIQHVRYHEATGLAPEFQQKRAEEIVSERDKATAAYVMRFYHVDWDDPLLYHMAINSDRWGIEAGARLIVHAVGCLRPEEASAEPAA